MTQQLELAIQFEQPDTVTKKTLLYDYRRDTELKEGETFDDGTTERVATDSLYRYNSTLQLPAANIPGKSKMPAITGDGIIIDYSSGYAFGITATGRTICLGTEPAVRLAVANIFLKSGIPEIDAVIELERELQGINKKDGEIDGRISKRINATNKRGVISANNRRARLVLHTRNRAPNTRRIAGKGVSRRISKQKHTGLPDRRNNKLDEK